MKIAKCDDGFEAKGETNEAVMEQLMAHLQTAHPEKYTEMMAKSEEDRKNEMMGMIKDEAPAA